MNDPANQTNDDDDDDDDDCTNNHTNKHGQNNNTSSPSTQASGNTNHGKYTAILMMTRMAVTLRITRSRGTHRTAQMNVIITVKDQRYYS